MAIYLARQMVSNQVNPHSTSAIYPFNVYGQTGWWPFNYLSRGNGSSSIGLFIYIWIPNGNPASTSWTIQVSSNQNFVGAQGFGATTSGHGTYWDFNWTPDNNNRIYFRIVNDSNQFIMFEVWSEAIAADIPNVSAGTTLTAQQLNMLNEAGHAKPMSAYINAGTPIQWSHMSYLADLTHTGYNNAYADNPKANLHYNAIANTINTHNSSRGEFGNGGPFRYTN